MMLHLPLGFVFFYHSSAPLHITYLGDGTNGLPGTTPRESGHGTAATHTNNAVAAPVV